MRLMLFSAHHGRATVGEEFNTGVLLSGANRKAFAHCEPFGFYPLQTSAAEKLCRAGLPQMGGGTGATIAVSVQNNSGPSI